MESHKFAYAAYKNHLQLRPIFVIIADKLREIRMSRLILKILKSSKWNSGKNLTAETLDRHLHTSTNYGRKKHFELRILRKYHKRPKFYVEIVQNLHRGCVTWLCGIFRTSKC